MIDYVAFDFKGSFGDGPSSKVNAIQHQLHKRPPLSLKILQRKAQPDVDKKIRRYLSFDTHFSACNRIRRFQKTLMSFRDIRSSLAQEIDLSHCICRKDSTESASCYIVRSHAADSRTIISYDGLPEMTVDEYVFVADKLGTNMGWCHLEVRSHGREYTKPCWIFKINQFLGTIA